MAEDGDAGLFAALLPPLVAMVQQYLAEAQRDPRVPVVRHRSPAALRAALPLQLGTDGCDGAALLAAMRRVLELSVRTAHPLFMAKLYQGSDPVGQAAELLASVLNTNCHTYEAAPVFTLMEVEVLRSMAQLLGLDLATHEGVFVPGGSYANMMGILLARDAAFPHVRVEGWRGSERAAILASDQAHYSVRKAAILLGLGIASVIAVPTDDNGRMTGPLLETAVREQQQQHGRRPFVVVATAGTTVLGAFDDLASISEVCQRYGLWLHVDATWGGAAAFSAQLAGLLLRGVELADSVVWNLHKAAGVPLQCSAFLTQRHCGALAASTSTAADYLFHGPAEAETPDLGRLTPGCGRRVDSLKAWLVWRHLGTNALAARIERAVQLAGYMAARVKELAPELVLVREPVYCNVCFWYVPADVRGQAPGDLCGQATREIAAELNASGLLMIDYSPLASKGLPNFFRAIVSHRLLQREHIDLVLDSIIAAGRRLYPSSLSSASRS